MNKGHIVSLPDEADSAGSEWLTPGRFAFLLALCVFAANPEVLVGSETFYYRDFGFFGYPLAHYHRESFWRGEIPLWNPLNNCGLPFLAQWNTLVLYPGSLFYLLFPLSWSLAVFCLLHQFLGGLGMFCLASRWTNHRLAASIAGVAYAFNGLTQNCLMWPNNIAGLGWMPWVILVSQRAWTGGGRDLAAAAVVASMQMLSGAPEIILLTWISLGALAAGQFFERLRGASKVFWRFAVVAFLAAGTSAAQLIPFLDLLSHAHRDAGYSDSAWAMPIWGWANLLVPMFHYIHGFHGVYWQREQYWTSSYYPGAAILVLAVLAAVLVRNRNARVLTLLAVLALILALGDAGVLYGWLRHSIPQFGLVRFPVKFLVLLSFALPLLAAYGVAHFQHLTPATRRRSWTLATSVWILSLATMLALMGYARDHPAREENWTLTWRNGLGRALFLTLTLAGFYLYYRLSNTASATPLGGKTSSPHPCSPPVEGLGVSSGSQHAATGSGILFLRPLSLFAGSAVILLLVLDLTRHVPRQNPVVSRQVFQPGLVRLSPQPRHGEGRAMISPANNLKLYRFATTNAFNDYINNRRLLFANCNLLDGIPKVNGFYSLYLREGDAVRAFLYDSTNIPPAALCDFLGASQITDPENFLEWKYHPGYLPLASSGQKPVFADEPTTFGAITSADFDPRSTVYLPLEARSFAGAVVSQDPASESSQPPSHRSGAIPPSPPASARSRRSEAETEARREGGEGDFSSASKRGLASSSPTGGGLPAREHPGMPTGSRSEPKIVAASFSAHRGEIQIAALEPSWLVIAQNNFHCWRATSDGDPLYLWQANYAFQAALVPAGKHLVQFVYRDWGFAAGTVLSVLTLIGCVAAAGFRVKRRTV